MTAEKSKIINQYKKRISELKKHNKKYFSDDKPEVTDAQYDKLKADLLKLEKKFPFLKKIENLSSIIGTPPSNKFKKIKHLKQMLSQFKRR